MLQTAFKVNAANSFQSQCCKQLSKSMLQTAFKVNAANSFQSQCCKQLSKSMLQTAFKVNAANNLYSTTFQAQQYLTFYYYSSKTLSSSISQSTTSNNNNLNHLILRFLLSKPILKNINQWPTHLSITKAISNHLKCLIRSQIIKFLIQ